MALKSTNRKERSKPNVSADNNQKNETQPISTNQTQASSSGVIEASSTDLSNQVDLQKLVNDSQASLQAQPQKRKRRTKAEMMQAQGGQAVTNQSSVNYAALPTQDFTMATEPLLQALDMAASSYFAKGSGIKAKDLRASSDDLKKAAQGLNQPLTVLSAHLGASADPVSAAYVAVGLTLGGLFLGKYFQAEELKNENNVS